MSRHHTGPLRHDLGRDLGIFLAMLLSSLLIPDWSWGGRLLIGVLVTVLVHVCIWIGRREGLEQGGDHVEQRH